MYLNLFDSLLFGIVLSIYFYAGGRSGNLAVFFFSVYGIARMLNYYEQNQSDCSNSIN